MSAGSLAAASATHIVEQVSSERATHGDDRVIRAVAGAMDLVHHVLRHPSLLWKTCNRRERDERVMCALPRAMVQERRWEILRACGSKLTVVVLLDHSVDGTRTPERHEHAVSQSRLRTERALVRCLVCLLVGQRLLQLVAKRWRRWCGDGVGLGRGIIADTCAGGEPSTTVVDRPLGS